jgi:hypothetical protein
LVARFGHSIVRRANETESTSHLRLAATLDFLDD